MNLEPNGLDNLYLPYIYLAVPLAALLVYYRHDVCQHIAATALLQANKSSLRFPLTKTAAGHSYIYVSLSKCDYLSRPVNTCFVCIVIVSFSLFSPIC